MLSCELATFGGSDFVFAEIDGLQMGHVGHLGRLQKVPVSFQSQQMSQMTQSRNVFDAIGGNVHVAKMHKCRQHLDVCQFLRNKKKEITIKNLMY